MPKRPSNDGAAWTAATIRKLAQLAKQGVTARAAAAELGRTPAAVQQKAMREGISFRAGAAASRGKKARAAASRKSAASNRKSAASKKTAKKASRPAAAKKKK